MIISMIIGGDRIRFDGFSKYLLNLGEKIPIFGREKNYLQRCYGDVKIIEKDCDFRK